MAAKSVRLISPDGLEILKESEEMKFLNNKAHKKVSNDYLLLSKS
jgi:hypothetical protein